MGLAWVWRMGALPTMPSIDRMFPQNYSSKGCLLDRACTNNVRRPVVIRVEIDTPQPLIFVLTISVTPGFSEALFSEAPFSNALGTHQPDYRNCASTGASNCMRFAQHSQLDPYKDWPLSTFRHALGCMRATVDEPSAQTDRAAQIMFWCKIARISRRSKFFSHSADDCDRIATQRR